MHGALEPFGGYVPIRYISAQNQQAVAAAELAELPTSRAQSFELPPLPANKCIQVGLASLSILFATLKPKRELCGLGESALQNPLRVPCSHALKRTSAETSRGPLITAPQDWPGLRLPTP